MKTKIEIKNIDGKVLFAYECENNTTKKTIEEAIRQDISLSEANPHNKDLSYVNLCGAKLCGANLSNTLLCKANLSGTNLS